LLALLEQMAGVPWAVPMAQAIHHAGDHPSQISKERWRGFGIPSESPR
jgi:hypothetical protein